MDLHDFLAQESTLIRAVTKAIADFAGMNNGTTFRQFAFDCNPDHGQILFCFDTDVSSRAFAQNHSDYLVDRRSKDLDYENDSLEWALDTIEHPSMPMVPFNNNVGDYSHQGFAEFALEGWLEFSLSDAYPGEFESSGDDYLKTVASVMLSRVADNLVSLGTFKSINMSSPFLIAYQLHDHSHTMVRMINCKALRSFVLAC